MASLAPRHSPYTSIPSPDTSAHLRAVSPPASTAYHGFQGDNLDLHRDDPYNFQSSPSTATTSATKFGARLLSNWSASQPAAAAAFTRSRSVLHSRAKSIASYASYVPKLNTSPEKQSAANTPFFGNLFNGESAPIRLGVTLPPTTPLKDEEAEFIMEYKPAFTERPQTRRHGTPPQSTATTSKVAGWFNRRTTLPANLPHPAPAPAQDEILAININASLFPHGPADQLSPHAFNDLLLNATTLLQKMQAAYKEKVDFIASIRPEMDVQREEVEEADIRSKHLKMQLEDLARRQQEQEAVMRDMAQQLVVEKRNVQQARDKTSVRLVRRDANSSSLTEDDENMPRRRKRRSEGTCSDSGFESDADYADSVLSSGLDAPSTAPHSDEAWQSHPPTVGTALSRHGTTSSSASASSVIHRPRPDDSRFESNLESLRMENRVLKRRMEQMGGALQDCIEFVDGVGRF